jgi:hypothetical protein
MIKVAKIVMQLRESLICSYPFSDDTVLCKNPTNALCMLTPRYSHYTFLHVPALRGHPQEVLIHFVCRVNKICVRMYVNIWKSKHI